MKKILLLGAGFSRTWGRWLASEVMGELCGRLQDRPWLVEMLQKMHNFEAVYGARGDAAQDPRNDQAQEDMVLLTRAIEQTFADMNDAFASLSSIELSTFQERSVPTYLSAFDAIYTLNQDLLLDLHYAEREFASSKSASSYLPGIEVTRGWREGDVSLRNRVALQVSSDRQLDDLAQRFIKLHGSTNWIDGEKGVMVIGTGKEQAIQGSELLRWYQTLLHDDLRAGGTRLMAIGYGFMDSHINRVIAEAAKETGLVMYLVNPQGPAVLASRRGDGGVKTGLDHVPLVGVSTRTLAETFGDAHGSAALWGAGNNVSFRSFQRFVDA